MCEQAYIYIYFNHRVLSREHMRPTIDLFPTEWLHSLVGRAFHPQRRGQRILRFGFRDENEPTRATLKKRKRIMTKNRWPFGIIRCIAGKKNHFFYFLLQSSANEARLGEPCANQGWRCCNNSTTLWPAHHCALPRLSERFFPGYSVLPFST